MKVKIGNLESNFPHLSHKKSTTSGSSKEEYHYEDDEKEDIPIEKTTFDKFVNYILCRGDLAEQKLKSRPVSLQKLLFQHSSVYEMCLFWMGVMGAIISGVAQPLMTLITGRLFDLFIGQKVRSNTFRHDVLNMVYGLFGMGIVVLIINFLQFMCFQHVCCRIIAKLRHEFLASIVRQNAGWFDEHHSGTIVTQLNDNVERIREGVGEKLGLLIRGIAMFIGGVVIAFCHNPYLALYVCLIAPLGCLSMSIMARNLGKETSEELKHVGQAGAIAEESIIGVRTVQAFNGQEEMVKRYRTVLESGSAYAVRKSWWIGICLGFFHGFILFLIGSGFALGGYLLKRGIIGNPGEIFTVVMSMMLSALFLGQISPHLVVLLNARVAAAVIYKTIERIPKIDIYSEKGDKPNFVKGRIEFSNVRFRYPTRKDVTVLNGISLTVEPGETVAFVGHSGCGKSTSVGLLTRLYEAESGKVSLDGTDVRHLNIGWLRNVIGIVQQEPILFNGTIEENVRIGHPHITIMEMELICRQANAHDFIIQLPQGYQTLIGDGGVQLSGGQRQRIAIARTLARNPRVLLLDEATSALDAQSESIVQSALDNASTGRTTIVIAHRLSTIRNADKIALFDKGQIIEIGTHDELVKFGGRYADLVRAQQFTQELEPSEENKNEDDQHLSLSRRSSISIYSTELNGREALTRGSIGSMNNISEDIDEEQLVAMEWDKKDVTKKSGVLEVFRYNHGNQIKMLLAFICAMIRGFLDLPASSLAITMVFVAFTYQKIDAERMQHELLISLMIYIALSTFTCLFHLISSVLFGQISESMTLNFREATLRNILRQDAAFFDNPAHGPGKLITRLATDAPNVKALMDGRMQSVTHNTAAWIILIIIALAKAWPVGVVGTILSVLLGVTQVVLARIIQKSSKALLKKNNAGKFSIEIIENVRTIQLLTREKYFQNKYVEASNEQMNNEMYKGWFEGINFAVSQTFIFFTFSACYGIGAHIVDINYIPSSEAYNAIIAMMLSCMSVMNSSTFFGEFVKARTAAGLMFSLIYRKPSTGDLQEGGKTNLIGNIIFEDVHFAYPQRYHQPVIRGLQLSVNRGQTVALVGPSGSGKSTAISLLERYYDITAGTIKFDGNDIKNLSLSHLRSQMALVGQEPRLFMGTIRENICLGLEKVSDEKIKNAVEIANASVFIEKMPQGLDTEVGERGTQLSGGQKQRIAIARALVRDPVILLLDEATSALDSESERAVQEALDRAREGRTCITIAHRLSSIQNADVIVYVENGKVRESGNHSSLMARKGKYYELIKKQDLSS